MRRKEVVEQIRRQAAAFIPEAQTILYGSEARGDARPDSDIDVLVVWPAESVTPEKEHFIATKFYEIELQTGVIISTVVIPKRQWDAPVVCTPFIQNVKREGIVL